jgi:hypothetical protein
VLGDDVRTLVDQRLGGVASLPGSYQLLAQITRTLASGLHLAHRHGEGVDAHHHLGIGNEAT